MGLWRKVVRFFNGIPGTKKILKDIIMLIKLTSIVFCYLAYACSAGSKSRSTTPNPNEISPPAPTDASEVSPKSEIVSATSTPVQKTDPRVTNVTLGPVSAKEDFTLEIVKKDVKGLAKETLWVDRDFNFSERVPEENRLNTEMVIQDIKECGFSLQGPACIDNQKVNVSTISVLTINGKNYVFLVFYYRMLKSPYAAFLEIDENDAGLSVNKIFIYELRERSSSYSPHGILKETIGTSIGVFEVKSLSRERAEALAKHTGNLRKKLYLLKWLAGNPGSFDPQKILANQSQVLAEIMTKEIDVIDSGELNLFYLYLKTMQQASSESDYHSKLSSYLENLSFESLKSEASIELLILGDSLSSTLLESLNKALLLDNAPTVLRALDVIVARKDEFPLEFFAHVIPLLNSEEVEVGNRTDLALTGVKIPEEFFPLLGKLIKRVGRNENTLPYAINHLISTNNPKAISLIYGELSYPKPEIRDVIYSHAYAFKADNVYLPVLQEQINKSQEIRILEFIIEKVCQSDTSEATQFIIENLYHKDVVVREKTMAAIKDRALTPAHLDGLFVAYNHRTEDIRLLQATLDAFIIINEPRGLNPVLQFIRTSQDESLRQDYIMRIQNSQFGEENIEELKAGVHLNNYEDVLTAFYEIVFAMDNFGSNDILIENLKTSVGEALKERILTTLESRTFGGNNPETLRAQWMGYNDPNRHKGLEYILKSQGAVASKVMAGYMVSDEENIRQQVIAELDRRKPVREMWEELMLNIMGGRVQEVIMGVTVYTKASLYQETLEASFRYLQPLVTQEDLTDLIGKFGISENVTVLKEFSKLFNDLFLEHPEYLASDEVRKAFVAIISNEDYSADSSIKLAGKAAVIRFVAALNDDDFTRRLQNQLTSDPENLNPLILSTLEEIFGVP